jgi:VanZ family protein
MRDLRWGTWWVLLGIVATLVGMYLALRPVGPSPAGGDKMMHMLSYVAMSIWFAAIYERRHAWRVGLALLVFSALIEVLQFFMPYGRAAEWGDMAANGIGIVTGLAVSTLLATSWMQQVERLLRRT